MNEYQQTSGKSLSFRAKHRKLLSSNPDDWVPPTPTLR